MAKLNDAMAYLASRKLAIDGESIAYTRSSTTLRLTAIIGRTQSPADSQNGRTVLQQADRDFLIDPATIVFGSLVTDPRKGDRIDYGGKAFEVWPTVDGEKCWSPSDGYGHLIRVHTRQEE